MLVHEKANAAQGRGGVAGEDLAGKSKHPDVGEASRVEGRRVTPPCSRSCFDVCSKNESAGAENHVQRVAN
jgi:hypothetical protein